MGEYKTLGVEVHYMDRGFSAMDNVFADGGMIYLFTDEDGHHRVKADAVKRTMVSEWLDSTVGHLADEQVCNEIWREFNIGKITSQLGIRSMMVGDRIVFQTNNHGAKRVYEVIGIGFARIK